MGQIFHGDASRQATLHSDYAAYYLLVLAAFFLYFISHDLPGFQRMCLDATLGGISTPERRDSRCQTAVFSL